MTPPKDCKELAMRLKQVAAPMLGRSYHDVRLAAAIIEDFDNCYPEHSVECVAAFLAADPKLYHVALEGDR